MCGKDKFAVNLDAIHAVMLAETPHEIKRISDGLNNKINVKVWMEKSAEKVILEVVKAKFGQSQLHRNYLLCTGDKVLAEVNPRDIHWSCRLAAKDTTQIIDTAYWPGQNPTGTHPHGGMQISQISTLGYTSE